MDGEAGTALLGTAHGGGAGVGWFFLVNHQDLLGTDEGAGRDGFSDGGGGGVGGGFIICCFEVGDG